MWPVVWTNIGKAAQNRETQELKNGKPKLDKARRLRGIYLIDPDDQDYKDTLKKCEEKIGMTHGSSHAAQKGKFGLAPRWWLQSRKMHPKRFQKLFMVLQGNPESTRQRAESLQSKIREDRIAEVVLR